MASSWTVNLAWKSHNLSMKSAHSLKISHSNHPKDVMSCLRRLEFVITHCEYLETCSNLHVAWKGTLWIVEINIMIKIQYPVIKHLCHRDLLFKANLEFYLSNINFVTSDFLDVGLHSKDVFSKWILYLLFRTCFRLYRNSVAGNVYKLLRGLFGQEQ